MNRPSSDTMAATSWILVADGSRARIFEAGAREERITEIADLANPQGKSSDNELASYSPGEGRPGPRTSTQENSSADHTVDLFSKYLARYLEKARTEHRYERVYLIAAPEFLGRLRQDLTAEVRKLVADELDKDISWFNARDIELYVRKAL